MHICICPHIITAAFTYRSPAAMANFDKNGRYLTKLFTATTLRSLATQPSNQIVADALRCSNELGSKLNGTLGDIFNGVFDHMCRSYRSEYIYKNAIATKILEGKHSLRAATFLSEFRVNQSKADTVILNGTSSVYEIKTELDDLARLPAQLDDYAKVFDQISVVTHEGGIDLLRKVLPDHVGIISLTPRYTLRTHRRPISNKANTLPEFIFSSLRQKEYLAILYELCGFVPNVPDALLYECCLERFRSLRPEEAHDAMVRILRMRSAESDYADFISRLPRSLKSVGLGARLTKKERFALLARLNSSYVI